MRSESQFFDQNRLQFINESPDIIIKFIIEEALNASALASATKIMKMRTIHWLSIGSEKSKNSVGANEQAFATIN